MAIQITRAHLDVIFRIVLLGNSVLAAVSVVLFLLSNWWIFVILGTLGLPFTATAIYLYRNTRLKGPIKRYCINFIVGIYNGIVQKRGFLLKRVYSAVLWFFPRNEWKHINWGYATLTSNGRSLGELGDADEEKRFYVQLYHHLATGMGNWNTLEGKNILELRCGGGGGLAYIENNLNPNQCIGVDEVPNDVQFGKNEYGQNPKMKFYVAGKLDEFADLEELKETRIDLALSIQSSKNVIHFDKFLQSIDSVLKPGGVFMFADLRPTEDWAEIEQILQSTSMKILKKEDISENVRQALKIDELDKWAIINRRFGSLLKLAATRIGIVKDNVIAGTLKNKSSQAKAFILHKPAQQNIQAAY